MKIAFFETTPQEELFFKQHLSEHELLFDTAPLNEQYKKSLKDVTIICPFVDSHISANVLATLPNLKLIVTRSTGFDQIDIHAAQERNVVVCNAPIYAAQTVAEYTFALLLNITRKLHLSYQQNGSVTPATRELLQGIDLAGKTIGIIGTGNIGKKVACLARAFSMNVIACDPNPDTTFACQQNIEYDCFERILNCADIISFHTTLNATTCHMLNSRTVPLLKKNAYIVNTARGGIIETAALVNGLKSGHIAGAALDVLEATTSAADRTYLMQHPNVIVTPHNAYNTIDAHHRLMETILVTINEWMGGKPINEVQP